MGIGEHFTHACELPPPPEPIDLRRWPARGAVVALLGSDDRLIQLLGTQNLRHAINRRLLPVEGGRSKRADLRAVTSRIAWIETGSAFENAWRYLEISRVLMPDRYQTLLAFRPCWFAGIDPAESHPQWRPDVEVFKKSVEVGPFPTRRTCQAFITTIEDHFDLCRKHDQLVIAPHGKACSYYDMGRCQAPCNGLMVMDAYRAQLSRSVGFATTDANGRRSILAEQMQTAAKALRFEQASHLKAVLAEDSLDSTTLQSALPVSRFAYLIIQRGSTRKYVKPFFMNCCGIEAGQESDVDNLDRLAPEWVDHVSSRSANGVDNPRHAGELISLVAFFTRKRGRGQGLFIHGDELESADSVVSRIRAHFGLEVSLEPLSDNG